MKMQDEQQFEQLMLLYNQLKNGAEDIKRMISNDDFDNAISMIKSREEVFRSCKAIRSYLELTPVQEKIVNQIVDELRVLELENISILSKNMLEVQQELRRTQKHEKIQQVYGVDALEKGSIINYNE